MRMDWLLPIAALLAPPLCGAQPATDPTASLPILDVNDAPFPRSSLVDFSPALETPAGEHGSVFVGTDGHSYFQDGSRARFWGINVAKDAVFVPTEAIDQAVDCIAAAGFNLVRLHHIDGVTGLLPPERAGEAQRIDPDRLDLLFYWVDALSRRGIYVYLDLLDFRTFQEAEGVPEAESLGRGAKPAAVYNERLIELQVDYARDLLFGQPNPYSGIPLGFDPAVAMVELCDENGLFRWIDKLDEIPEPYRSELAKRWNFWLRGVYGSTEVLSRAWVRSDGRAGLGQGESIEEETVRLHLPASPRPDFPSPTGAPMTGVSTPARERDLARFCHEIHRQYFAQMRQALRDLGLEAPISAVTEWSDPADLLSVTDELDYVGINWYYDHPVFSASRQWRVPSFFENGNPVADERGLDFACASLRAATDRKPLVLREWGACWPSKFRGVGLLEAAAHAAHQDIDAMIMFTYDTRPDARRIEYFDVSSDPVRWGVAAVAGEIYRTRAVSPAVRRVAMAASREDALSTRRRPPIAADLMRLSWVSQLRQLAFDQGCNDNRRDLLIATGLSASTYSGERVLFPGGAAVAALQLSGYGLLPRDAFKAPHTFAGFAHDAGTTADLAEGLRFEVADLQAAGLEPIGLSEDGALAGGFRDGRRSNVGLLEMGPDGMLRAALDLIEPGNHGFVDRRRYVSDTGQIVRDLGAERLTIDAPRAQAIAGAFGGTMSSSVMSADTPSSLGVLAAMSLDDAPIEAGGPALVKMVTVAANTGEKKGTRDVPPQYPQFQLDDFGDAPVLTHGRPSDTPTTVTLAGEAAISVYMVNGTWEAVRTDRAWYVWCDTPRIRISLPALGDTVGVVPHGASGPGDPVEATQPFTYPDGCRFVRVTPAP